MRSLVVILILATSLQSIIPDTDNIPDPIPYIEQAEGFSKGTALFTKTNFCDYQSPEMQKAAVLLIDLLLGPKPNGVYDIIDYIIDILQNLEIVEKDVSNLKPECVETLKEMNDAINQLNVYMSDPNYQTNLAKHSALNALKINSKITDFQAHYNERTHYQNGFLAGDLARFVLFWNINIKPPKPSTSN